MPTSSTKINATNKMTDKFVDQLIAFASKLQSSGWKNRDILELLQHAEREATPAPTSSSV